MPYGFDPGSVHVGFVVDKVSLGQAPPPEYFGFPLSIHSTGAPLLVKMKKNYHLSSSSQGCTRSLNAAVRP
jgi:hypothetical protein